jgi:DNA (cytosine-5)-methyltransferase 1
VEAYYNEIDGYCCDWLSNLMDAGLMTPGKIDDRRIENLSPDDVRGYERVHFFAGIGGWDYALDLAGWHGPVWTGSCPCQPFSAAGRGKAADDERHLWPAWFSLIRECSPAIVFGEQVEAAIGWGWLDAVLSDLEAQGYACGAAILPACGVGAPHIRQRVWFMANAQGQDRKISIQQRRPRQDRVEPRGPSRNGELADPASEQMGFSRQSRPLGHAQGEGLQGPRSEQGAAEAKSCWGQFGLPNNPWTADWLPCTDGKARPVEPGTFPLAHGIPGRVGRLRAYGNAIVPQVAAEFIRSACHGGQ